MVDELRGNDGQREKNEITMRARKKKDWKWKKEKEENRKVRKKETKRQIAMEYPKVFIKAIVTTADGTLCHTASDG